MIFKNDYLMPTISSIIWVKKRIYGQFLKKRYKRILLQVPVNAPVAEVRRVLTDAAGRVIYLGEVKYRGDFIRLQMTLK